MKKLKINKIIKIIKTKKGEIFIKVFLKMKKINKSCFEFKELKNH
jgi:hypothetical protein